MTRDEEYNEIRTLLDDPKTGKPSAHAVLSQQIATEQRQLNRLSNTARAWTLSTTTITTAANTAEYPITAANFGKLKNAYRALSDNSILPVPFTDYSTEILAPSYDVWIPTGKSGESVSGQKLGVFRKADGAIILRIFPVPSEAKTITLVYVAGALSVADFDFDERAVLPEFARHRCLQTALFLLPRSEWEGYSRDEARQKRNDLREAMQAEFLMEEKEFDQYIRNPMQETIGSFGNFYE